MAVSIILHIPHASTEIPFEDEGKFLPLFEPVRWDSIRGINRHLKEERRQRIQEELLFLTDWYTDELFDHGLGTAVIAPQSRLVCDVERLVEGEPMEEEGMGFCYTKGYRKEIIKEFSREYREDVLFRYYAPHHRKLEDIVEEKLLGNDGVLILDCHSFFPEPLPYEKDQTTPRPDFCIGTDPNHTPTKLVDLVVKFFERKGYRVGINTPYSGTIYPHHLRFSGPPVVSIMVEVNRGLYLEKGSNRKNADFQKIQTLLLEFQMVLQLALNQNQDYLFHA